MAWHSLVCGNIHTYVCACNVYVRVGLALCTCVRTYGILIGKK